MTRKLKGFRGLHQHRFWDNPEEKRFAVAWFEECERGHLLEWLLGDGTKRVLVSERDAVVADTVVQWLGSPVGQCWLEELGYYRKGSDEDD